MTKNIAEKIFFYCTPSGPPDNTRDQYEIVTLAEGLKQLGIKFCSNIDFWRLSSDREEYLFEYDPECNPDDCTIVVFNGASFDYYGNQFPRNLFHPRRNYLTVYMDRADGIRTPSFNKEFRQFDLILKTHYNQKYNYPANVKPWAYGLSDRILDQTQDIPSFEERKRILLFNFRVNHTLRAKIRNVLLPNLKTVLPVDESIDRFDFPPTNPDDYLQWAQTGRRHYPQYYQRLKQSAACACFGGKFIPVWPRNLASLQARAMRKIVNSSVLASLPYRFSGILQWDSWRFWESLAAGCVTFHVDFEQNGLVLPVIPSNWQHYIGVDLDNIQATVDQIAKEPEILAKISVAGRQWAIEHYSPRAIATRFLETLQTLK